MSLSMTTITFYHNNDILKAYMFKYKQQFTYIHVYENTHANVNITPSGVSSIELSDKLPSLSSISMPKNEV